MTKDDEQSGYTAAKVDELSERLARFESTIEKKLDAIMSKLEQRQEWEKNVEIRLAKLDTFTALATWAAGLIVSALILGGLAFFWAVSTGAVHIVNTP